MCDFVKHNATVSSLSLIIASICEVMQRGASLKKLKGFRAAAERLNTGQPDLSMQAKAIPGVCLDSPLRESEGRPDQAN